jgi:putative membrane protein
MIVPEKQTWLGTLTTFRGSTVSRTWRRVTLVTFVAILVTWLHEDYGLFHSNLTLTPFTLIGLPLGIFLGFRNTTSYDRFWEGRRLWGGVVNVSRNLSRQIATLVRPDPRNHTSEAVQPVDDAALMAHHDRLIRRVIAYVHALRVHLREEEELADIRSFLDPEEFVEIEREGNRPFAILHHFGAHLRSLYERGWIHPQHYPLLEQSLSTMTDLQGGCERIRATPIPYSYNVLLHRIVFVYCFALPFGLVDIAGLSVFTPVVAAFVSYAFFGLDAVGDEIENPFGLDVNDLPLSAITRMIEINLLQRLGVSPLPPALRAVDEVLN